MTKQISPLRRRMIERFFDARDAQPEIQKVPMISALFCIYASLCGGMMGRNRTTTLCDQSSDMIAPYSHLNIDFVLHPY